MVIADGPVTSAGAARTLDGKVAGSKERGDIAIQKAPPVKPKADTRRTASKKFGPMQVGAGNLSARAVWAHGMACGKAAGDTSSASAEISRVTIAGGGSASLVRVPEKITSRSGTALRLRGGVPQSVGSSTITAGRISLVDNEVRIRVLRAPELRASMTATGQSRVEYRPPVVEVVGRDGKKNRLSTAGDHIAITLSEESRSLESLPSRLDPIGDPPLPQVSGLPVLARTETTPSPDVKPGSTLRIALGEVRQASKNNAVAARATAIRVTLTRNVDNGAASAADRPSGVVADLGIGMLAAAAVAPNGRTSGRSSSAGDKPAQASPAGKGYSSKSGRGATAGWGDAARPGNISGQTFKPGQGNASGRGSTPGQGNATTTGAGNTPGQATTTGAGNTPGQGFARGDGDVSGPGIGSGDGSSDGQSLSPDAGSGSSQDAALGGVGASGTSGQSGTPGQNGTPGQSLAGPGAGLRGAALPITGPRVVSLLIAGVAMIGVGAAAVYLTSRRRRRS
ncbi:hypothetical protein Q0Z83_084750 [Actinoplanes sichuanensis]|uniref:Gram-positive cocci surface proteins LPxTG domain-containing protein n=1 Tax=Actinoplanes sichuanensis TaxID=512349 RepID=A0ABW4AWM6_9ACTN|nr:hypothetical protein [Actinoplanes sichuanensis]BEL10284.1 hypothetical protein Q0Z83_084750 [Actinoplanes sichuanensis]